MFTTDERAASFLKFNGVQFEYDDRVKYNELHPDWKGVNIGRQQPVDQDAVLDYAIRQEAGSPAPAVIVIPQADGLCVLDGVQRLMAGEQNNLKAFCAYVLSKNTSLTKQHLIRICANAAINGQHTPDKSFLLEQAVHILYFQDSCSSEEIARAIGRTHEQILDEVRFQKTSNLMEGVGYQGKLLTRNKKWFVSLVGKHADQTDWETAPGPLKEMLRVSERVASKNGFLEPLVAQFFSVKRGVRKDRREQFQRKLSEFKKAPEIAQKLETGKGKHHLDNVLPGLRRVLTSLDKASDANEIVHDREYAVAMADVLRRVWARCREVVPRDLQYADGRRASIFDKG